MRYFWLLILVGSNALGQSADTVTALVKKLAQDEDGIFLSDQNKSYALFQKIVTNRQLEELTQHPAASVRVYAFLTLLKRKSSKIESIFRNHLQDTTYLTDWTQGCVIYFSPPVSEYMLGK